MKHNYFPKFYWNNVQCPTYPVQKLRWQGCWSYYRQEVDLPRNGAVLHLVLWHLVQDPPHCPLVVGVFQLGQELEDQKTQVRWEVFMEVEIYNVVTFVIHDKYELDTELLLQASHGAVKI
jgi:hypothetical protein